MISWYVVRTQPRAEAKALENLLRQGYEAYLPRERRWRFHARRREVVLRPLFPGYMFVGFDLNFARWRSIFSTRGVASLVCHGDVPSRLPNSVVEQIRTAERAGLFDEASVVARLQPGNLVRIARGPLADMTGQLQLLLPGDRVRVLLRMLGQEVSTTLDLAEVASV